MTTRDDQNQALDAAVRGAFSSAGRAVTEAEVTDRTVLAGSASPSDFRAAGLGEAASVRAARGLAEGMFLSFEDACASAAAFDTSGGSTLCTPARVAEVAARISPQAGPTVREDSGDARERELVEQIAEQARTAFGLTEGRAREYAEAEAASTRALLGPASAVKSLERRLEAMRTTAAAKGRR